LADTLEKLQLRQHMLEKELQSRQKIGSSTTKSLELTKNLESIQKDSQNLIDEKARVTAKLTALQDELM
jgi:hypothetical protein